MTQLHDEQVHRCLSPDPGPLDAAVRRDLASRVLDLLEVLARQSTRGDPPQVSERLLLPGDQPDQRA